MIEVITVSKFSDMLFYLRNRAGISQKELADALNMSRSAVSMYELGQREPTLEVFEAFADYFNVDMNTLTGNSAPTAISGITNMSKIPPLRSIPLIGNIACGTPILAAQNIEANIFLPETVNADYALRCKGDSMTGADILDGDIVYIRQDADVINGQIYAVMIGEGEVTEATLKHVYQTPDTLTLTADNPAYPPMIYQGEQLARVRIIGKAVGFTRKI